LSSLRICSARVEPKVLRQPAEEAYARCAILKKCCPGEFLEIYRLQLHSMYKLSRRCEMLGISLGKPILVPGVIACCEILKRIEAMELNGK